MLQTAPHIGFQALEAPGAAADHDDIRKCFPTIYGRPRVQLQAAPVPAAAATASASAAAAAVRPMRLGVVLSGGQAPGGHNVIAGIFDYVKRYALDSRFCQLSHSWPTHSLSVVCTFCNIARFALFCSVSKDSTLIGFMDGPQGVYRGQYCEIDDNFMNGYRNSGGFDSTQRVNPSPTPLEFPT